MEQKNSENIGREQRITRVTLWGCLMNTFLFVIKLVAGVLGASAAMIADAVHSLSDFLTDVVVLLFYRRGEKRQIAGNNHGHAKNEALIVGMMGLLLLILGITLGYKAIDKVVAFRRGVPIASPGIIAFVAALLSIVLKEWAYRFTIRCGRSERSYVVEANAWHHRMDALSSMGTALCIGGAIFLGSKWAVLDPIAAGIVCLFIIRTAYYLIDHAFGGLMERSFPRDFRGEAGEITEEQPSQEEEE